MALENLKNQIHQGINELFVTASMDEIAGDMEGYKEKLNNIAVVADALGIETEVTAVTLCLKSGADSTGQ